MPDMHADKRSRTGFAPLLLSVSILLFLFLVRHPAGEALAMPSSTAASSITVYTVKPDYHPAKFEPAHGVYLGAYVLQDEYIGDSMSAFERAAGKHHASYFKYVGYGRPFPTEWVDQVKANGSVPHIAWEPNNGLDEVKDNAYLHQFAKAAKAANVPIFLRYASEMNGDWAAYSGNPEAYIRKWRMVYNVMKQEAPNVAMVWTVFTFPESTILKDYPGDDYVDWVGVNIYNVYYHNHDIHDLAYQEDPLNLLDYVYNRFAYRKPIQISEFGATHFDATDQRSHIPFAAGSIQEMYDNLPDLYPRVKSIYYFDVNNLLNAPEGRKYNDYSITDQPDVLQAYKSAIQDKRYLTRVADTDIPQQTTTRETLSYRDFLFRKNGILYVDLNFFTDYLGLPASVESGSAVIQGGFTVVKAPILNQRVYAGFKDGHAGGFDRTITGIPLRAAAEQLGYEVDYNAAVNKVWVLPKSAS